MEHNLQEALMEKLQPEVVFTLPIFGGIPVTSSVVVTWIIMFILVFASILMTGSLKAIPTGKQNIIEALVDGINSFIKGIIGHEWKIFAPYLGTVALFLSIANIAAVFGFTPPTKDLNVTAALSVMTIALVVGAGVRFKGFKGWLKGFKEPLLLIMPMNILELFIRPLSLSMRLFGNVLGSYVIMELLMEVIPLGIPAILSLYFDIFDGLIQMIIFVFLSALFIKEGIE
ncbi:F0F1 ATP synthase subunit A [Petroclostridium sp. X23]|uniref:F0F1 ATP synthase subunit A n=1 Tax=Petroclostridium sp. X23 TaxID=3045146 RepID=UPI0024AE5540|nr:F0F1 ATP synthase subunit A [Petroclostridium sp. X23]WHH57222.1 F0F1 ATP synthase subunit A [Petroclostridium sp. X23]